MIGNKWLLIDNTALLEVCFLINIASCTVDIFVMQILIIYACVSAFLSRRCKALTFLVKGPNYRSLSKNALNSPSDLNHGLTP